MSLCTRRLLKERTMVERNVAGGVLQRAVWAENLETVQVTHDGGEVFGDLVTEIKFPSNYPNEPPSVRILSEIRHPNVYRAPGLEGVVCMSILDAEAATGQPAVQCWTPAYNVVTLISSLRTILLEPATDSPADVDANVIYLRSREEYQRVNKSFKDLRVERQLKYEQEKAFAEASLRDQEREVELRDAEEESRLQEQVEEAKRRSKVEARGAEEARKALEVQEAELTLPAEPPADSAVPLANIRFRTPSETLARRFLATDTLRTLLLFLQSKGYRPEEYKVLSTYPRRDLSGLASSSSLEALKLCPQETITLEAITNANSDSN